MSQTAREQQARLIVEDATAYPDDYPQLLTGDMNCDGANAAIERFRQGGWQDTHAALHGDENPDTFHGSGASTSTAPPARSTGSSRAAS